MRSSLITVLTFALVAGAAVFVATPADALKNCISCSTTLANTPPTTTVIVGEDPIDCVWAEMAAMAEAEQLCGPDGFCQFDTQVLNNCHNNPDPDGIFRAHLEVTYVCRICIDMRSSVNPTDSNLDHLLDSQPAECPAPVVAAE